MRRAQSIGWSRQVPRHGIAGPQPLQFSIRLPAPLLFIAETIPPNVSGLSFSADRLSAVLVGRGSVRAKARNFHFSFFLGTLVIPTSLL
jgi:hypothetical protein